MIEGFVRILLLEDSPHDVYLIEPVLRKKDLHCLMKGVDDKVTFTVAMLKFDPDTVVADHSMPDFNSVEALMIARAKVTA